MTDSEKEIFAQYLKKEKEFDSYYELLGLELFSNFDLVKFNERYKYINSDIDGETILGKDLKSISRNLVLEAKNTLVNYEKKQIYDEKIKGKFKFLLIEEIKLAVEDDNYLSKDEENTVLKKGKKWGFKDKEIETIINEQKRELKFKIYDTSAKSTPVNPTSFKHTSAKSTPVNPTPFKHTSAKSTTFRNPVPIKLAKYFWLSLFILVVYIMFPSSSPDPKPTDTGVEEPTLPKNGKHTIFYPEGNEMNYWKFEGTFRNDKKEGKGILFLLDGTRYEGNWKNDMRDGVFTYYDNEGNKQEQYFSEGERIR